MNYSAVIFDMDGVIFDSERAVLECWLELAKERGIENIEEQYYKCVGTNTSKNKEIFIEAYGEEFAFEEVYKASSVLFHSKYDGGKLPMKPGVFELLDFLKVEGKTIALASSTRKETVTKELQWAGLLDYFDLLVCGDMIKNSKPAPDIFLQACEKLGITTDEAYVIEDSYNGIRAAHNAGIRSIMVPDMLKPDAEMEEKAEMILPSLLDVIEYLMQ